jgi:eukaryotic-like serine/threonine-protein kinase
LSAKLQRLDIVDQFYSFTGWSAAMQSGVQIDRYALVSVRGGQAEVWRARDLLTGEICAVKIVDVRGAEDDHLERIIRESRALARLRHPSLCRCRGLFEDVEQEVLGLSMNFVNGRNMREVAAELDATRAERAVRHVAAALAHVHEHGLVHRDVKPENIILTDDFEKDPDDPGAVRQTGRLPRGSPRSSSLLTSVGERRQLDRPARRPTPMRRRAEARSALGRGHSARR